MQGKRKECPDCKGKRIVLEWGKYPRTCNRCQGSGKVGENG